MLSYRSARENQEVAPGSGQPEPATEYGPNGGRIGLLDGEVETATPLLDEAGRAPGFEVQGRSPVGPQTKEAALQRHEANLRQVASVLAQARGAHDPDPTSPDFLFHNAGEWLESEMAKLVVVSPTHDSHQRKAVGEGQAAYFDERVGWGEGGADYQKGREDGILVADRDQVGGHKASTDRLTLIDPGRMSPSAIAALIVHEVQHDADQSAAGQRWQERVPPHPNAVDSAPSVVYNAYQSEFRAYWATPPTDDPRQLPEPREGSISVPVKAVYRRTGQEDLAATVATGFHNTRQEAIFHHLWNQTPDQVYKDESQEGPGRWLSPYGYLPHYYVFDPAFRAMVDSLSVPSGGNLVNSVRIEALAAAIDKRIQTPIHEAARALDATDRSFLADRTASAPFWDQARSKLAPEELEDLERRVTP